MKPARKEKQTQFLVEQIKLQRKHFRETFPVRLGLFPSATCEFSMLHYLYDL